MICDANTASTLNHKVAQMARRLKFNHGIKICSTSFILEVRFPKQATPYSHIGNKNLLFKKLLLTVNNISKIYLDL